MTRRNAEKSDPLKILVLRGICLIRDCQQPFMELPNSFLP